MNVSNVFKHKCKMQFFVLYFQDSRSERKFEYQEVCFGCTSGKRNILFITQFGIYDLEMSQSL